MARHLDALSLVKSLAVELGRDHIVFVVHTPARDTLVDTSSAVARSNRRDGDPLPGVGLAVARRLKTVGRHKGPRRRRARHEHLRVTTSAPIDARRRRNRDTYVSLSQVISPRETESRQALSASVVLRVMLARTSWVGAAIGWSSQSKQSLEGKCDSSKSVANRGLDQLKLLRDKEQSFGMGL